MFKELKHGTIVEFENSLPIRMQDRQGTPVFEAEWTGQTLVGMWFRTPDDQRVVVRASYDEHPLFGLSDLIFLEGGPALARFQAVEWANPSHIPPLDRPGALPSGAGTAILNFLAQQALRRERQTLRYRGPYPTGALFDALMESFRLEEPLIEAFKRFTVNVEETAVKGEVVEVPVDFIPAPFERLWIENGVCVQLREGVEKVFINGRAYTRDAAGARRVRQKGDNYVAGVEIGGEMWAEVLTLDRRGGVIEGPVPLPAVNNPFVGQPLPDSIRKLLVEALPPRAPAMMQPTLKHVLAEIPIVWDDAGDDVALLREGTIVLHAVLLERSLGQPPPVLLTTIAQAIEPVAHRLAQALLARTVEDDEEH